MQLRATFATLAVLIGGVVIGGATQHFAVRRRVLG